MAKARAKPETKRAIEICYSNVDEILTKAPGLMRSHWEEIMGFDGPPLNIDELRYKALEKAEALLCLAAWNGDELVGYSVTIVATDLKSQETLIARNEALFVSEAFRNVRVGGALMKQTAKEAKKMGARHVLWHSKFNSDLSQILMKREYPIQEVVFRQEL